MSKLYLTLKLLPVTLKSWWRPLTQKNVEADRQQDTSKGTIGILEHLYSVLSSYFIPEGHTLHRWTEKLKKLADSRAQCHTILNIQGQLGRHSWGSTGPHVDEVENKNGNTWIMFTYNYLYLVLPGKIFLKEYQDYSPCLNIAWLSQQLFSWKGAFSLHLLYFHKFTKLTVFDMLLI